MTAVLTGALLAASAGLNAYIPLLALGLLGKFTSWVELPAAWAWISHDWALILFGVLLVIEMVVDKVPALDTVNDVLGTIVRPAAGGMVFTAGTGSTTIAAEDPSQFFSGETLGPMIIGIVIALVPHVLKALGRPIANTLTGGAAAPVMSTAEDVGAVTISLLAIIVPVVALIVLLGLVFWLARRIAKARRLKREPGLQKH